MKYVILIYSNPQTWRSLPQHTRDAIIKTHNDLLREIGESGEFLNIYRLADARKAKTIQPSGAAPVVSDGPFGESKEVLASTWEIEVDSLERAIEICRPLADHAVVELRPLMDASGQEM